MPRHRNNSTRLARQATELAVAVPQVVAHRLTRMALAGPVLSARDRREFHGMAQEKVHAFWQSWFAMGWAMTQAVQQAWIAALQGARVPLLDTQRILSQGMAPVHRKATANARRLARLL
ncbi:MAG TPA: polyhydroxyalkanoate granule-associated phasin [Ramlibacter sp.]|nr:polyhydroxyalkanoate granule-associated phasin [Ramlibacter sp.]